MSVANSSAAAKGEPPRRRHRRSIVKHRVPGTSPGMLHADPAAHPTRVHVFSYGPDALEELDPCAPGDLERLRGKRAMLWADVTGLADVALIERVGRLFGLHQLALEDVVSGHQRPKAEDYDNHGFVILRMLLPGDEIDSDQVSLLIGDGFLVTFQERPGDCLESVRNRLRAGKGKIRQMGADYLAYAVIDATIDGYFPVLEGIGEQIEQLEDDVIARPEPNQVDRLHRIKRDLLLLRRAVWPTRDLVNDLIRDDSPHIGQTARLYLRDCYDHTVQLMDIVETYREIGSSLLDVYLSSLSTRMNEIMKVLTIIATIFIPLSFIAAVWGMNFDPDSSPWNMPELRWYLGYPLALLLMAVVGFGLLFWFWRRGWIGRRRK